MSAYIVDRNHIRFLVESATAMTHPYHRPFKWWIPSLRRARLLRSGNATEVGQMLWDENIASVRYRYSSDPDGDLPGPIDEDFVYLHQEPRLPFRPTPAEVLKAADCYYYQSCEHPEWSQSDSLAFINALRAAAWAKVEGYEEAPWGAPAVE